MDVPKWIVDKVQPRLDAGVPRILAVEGPDDVKIYATWLERLVAPTGQPFSSQVDLVDAGSKRTLLKGLRWLRDYGGDPQTVFGLADRDEWEQATIQAMTQELPRLRVNEKRHCLEKLLLRPGRDHCHACPQGRWQVPPTCAGLPKGDLTRTEGLGLSLVPMGNASAQSQCNCPKTVNSQTCFTASTRSRPTTPSSSDFGHGRR